MGSLVFCIHHKQGCKWSDELRKLKVIIQQLINLNGGQFLNCHFNLFKMAEYKS